MAFSFAAQPQDYMLRAQAGLPLDPSLTGDQVSGQAAQMLAAPPQSAPQAAPQASVSPPGYPAIPDVKVSPMEAFLSFLSGGGSPAEAAQRARAVKVQNMMAGLQLQQAQDRFRLATNLSDPNRLDYLTNPEKYAESDAKNNEPQKLAPNETAIFRGGPGNWGGAQYRAPGIYEAKDGIVLNTGTGPTGSYATPQAVAPGASLKAFQPGYTGPSGAAPVGPPGWIVNGGPPPAAQPGAAPGAAMPGPQAAPSPSTPRGLRNANPGNLMALPNGHQWAGQTGVDSAGYAVFGSPQDGINAARTNLQSYATKHGINTVAGVVSRWAPQAAGNATANYTHYVAGSMGVGPNQPLNMADPKVQDGLLKGIFSFENGPKHMAELQAAQQVHAATQTPAPLGGQGTVVTDVAQGSVPRVLSPEETRAAGYAPGTVVEKDAAGHLTVSQAPQYDAAWDRGQRDSFQGNEAVKQYTAVVRPSYEALVKNIGQMTGPAAYAILDTAIRTDNPGATTRQQQLDSFEHKFGVGGEIMGKLLNFQGKGTIPKDIQQKIVDAAAPFAQSHYDAARAAYDANASLAKSHGRNPDDVTVPIGSRPERYVLGPAGAVPESAVVAEAKAAIAKGASPAAVRARLKSYGISGGL